MTTLQSLVGAAEATYADRIAVRCGEDALSFGDVADRSSRAANLLRALHGQDDGIVALLIGNRLEAIELDVALIKAGLGRVSINPRLAPDEIRYVLQDSGARVLVYDPAHAEVVADVHKDVEDLLLVSLGDSVVAPALAYETELARAPSGRSFPAAAGDSPSLLMYTSGTSGRPKAATWTNRTRTAAVVNMLVNELDSEAARVMMHVGSLSHGSGSKVVPVYLRGGCNLVMPRFEPEEIMTAAGRHGATASFMVPTMVQMLVEQTRASEPNPLQAMRHIAYGGAKMPMPTIEAALDLFGDIFVQVYGSCEAPHPMLVLSQSDHAQRDQAVLQSAGRPSIGVDVRVGKPDEAWSPGSTGEILLRAPSIMSGYWRDEAATAASFDNGYYKTGDVGLVHPDGLVEVIGRTKSVIISGGFNVYPAEVERVLLEHPQVAQACVYGLDDARWGERVAAAVVPRPGAVLAQEELTRHCENELAAYKKPRTFLVREALPLGSTGKVLTSVLKQEHREAEGS